MRNKKRKSCVITDFITTSASCLRELFLFFIQARGALERHALPVENLISKI